MTPSRMLDGRATHVQTGSLGTPTHAAPELLREGRLASPADVYAFGVLGKCELRCGSWAGVAAGSALGSAAYITFEDGHGNRMH